MPTNKLRYWRLKKDTSITELARRSGLTTRVITKIEADENYVAKADTMQQLAWAGLGLPVFVVFFPKEYEMVRKAMFNMMRRHVQMMTPDSLFNMSHLGLDALADDLGPFGQPQNTQSYSEEEAAFPAGARRASK